MNHDYAAAIEVLMNEQVDFRAICIELAKTDPVLFVRLSRAGPVAPWMIEVISKIRNAERVAAIKAMRQATGFGLKEAKDVCDLLQDWMWDNNKGVASRINAWTPLRDFNPEQVKVYNAFVAAL